MMNNETTMSMREVVAQEYGWSEGYGETHEAATYDNKWEIILTQFYVDDYRIFVVDNDCIKDYLDMFNQPPAMNGFRVIGENTYMKVHYTDKNAWYHCYWSAIKFMAFLGGWIRARVSWSVCGGDVWGPMKLNYTSNKELEKCKRRYYDWAEYHIAERKMRIIKDIAEDWNGDMGIMKGGEVAGWKWDKPKRVPVMGVGHAIIWQLTENYVLGLFDDKVNVNEEWVWGREDRASGGRACPRKRKGYSYPYNQYYNIHSGKGGWGGWVMTRKDNMCNYYDDTQKA